MTPGHHYLHTMHVFEHISNKILFTTSSFGMLPWYARLNITRPAIENMKFEADYFSVVKLAFIVYKI